MRESEIRNLGGNWYQEEKFWNLFAPLIFNDARWQRTETEIDGLLKLINAEKNQKILDACCGVGRHSIELAKRGLRVTGIDITKSFLEAAGLSAEAEGVAVDFIESDILRYTAPNTFDHVINMYTSFGYFESEDDNALFLKNMRANLKPGGKILIETIGKELISRDFKETEWYEHEGSYILASYEITDNWTKLKNRWIIVNKENRYDYTFTHSIYSASELMKMMRYAGFSDIRVYGDLKGTSYDLKAENMIITGVKA